MLQSVGSKINGTESQMVAECHNDIGTIYHTQAKYPEALKESQEALSINMRIFGNRHESVALAYNNIGASYYEMGDYVKSLIQSI